MYNEIDLDKIDLRLEPPTEEPDRQYYFMAKCREWVKDFKQKNGRFPSAFIQTFGCQMNSRDSEKLLGVLKAIGYQEADSERADFVLYNTCTVRENANQKVYGKLGFLQTLKRKNPEMKIAVCGCMMQEADEIETIKRSYRFVDIVFGTHNIYKLAELLACQIQTKKQTIDVWENTTEIVEDLPNQRKFSFKSGVNIMFGCNNFCSYCIVPYVRGRERSRNPEDILAEVKRLAADGVVEIMLLGQNVNSYGKTLKNPSSFAQLLQKVEKVEGIERIRFMTPHPKDLSDELIAVMAQSKKICRQIHLPIQSGSTEILKKMNRHYTKEQYLALVERIRAVMPDISITTDIIVGFPGETEADFLETLDVVRKVRYDSAFTFIYSKRSGTPAAKMSDQVPKEVVKERFERLLAEIQKISSELTGKDIGKTELVLVEEQNTQNPEMMTGRLSNNLVVHFLGGTELIGKLLPIKLKEAKGFYYIGEQVEMHGKDKWDDSNSCI